MGGKLSDKKIIKTFTGKEPKEITDSKVNSRSDDEARRHLQACVKRIEAISTIFSFIFQYFKMILFFMGYLMSKILDLVKNHHEIK